MSIIVDHEKRRMEILENALDVFVEEGFHNVTLQKIADRCNITRTTLYNYFKNKREIFNFSIKSVLRKVNDNIQVIYSNDSLGCIDKITHILFDIFSVFEENRRLLMVILNYLLHISKKNIDPEKRIRRLTFRLRHIFSSLVIQGIKTGELKPVNIKTAGDLLQSLVEAAIYRLVVLQCKNTGDLRKTSEFIIKQLANNR